MRQSAALLAFGLLLLTASPSRARSANPLCGKIRKAINAGHTVDQILHEFDADAAQVAECLQKRGRRRAGAKEKKAKAGKQSHNAAPATTKSTRQSESSAQQPSRPRSAVDRQRP